MASKVTSKATAHKILNLSTSSTRKSSDTLNEQLYAAVAQANKIGELLDKRLSFYIDTKTRKVVVNVIDKSTGNIVRVLPPGEMLKMAAHLRQLKVLNDRVIGAAESVILDYN